MKLKVLAVTALVALLGTGTGRAQEGVLTGDTAKGAAVLADARKALGGDKLSAVKAFQFKGSFRRTAGNNQVEGDLEFTVQLPAQMKRVDDTSAPGGGPAIVSTQVLNGTEVWDENPGRGGGFAGGFGGRGFGGAPGGGGGRGGGGPRPGAPADGQAGQGNAPANGGRGAIDPERLRLALLRQRQGDFQRMVVGWLLTTDAPAAWVATAESPDGKADVLEIKPADGAAMRLFLDASTHMPLMITWQGAVPQGRGGGRRGQPGGTPQGAPGGPQGVPAPGAQAVPAPAGGGVVQGGATVQGTVLQGPGDDAAAGPRRGGPPPAATLQMTFGDYKAVNGVKFPHTVTRGISGQTNEEWTISSYKVNPSLKADFFVQKKN